MEESSREGEMEESSREREEGEEEGEEAGSEDSLDLVTLHIQVHVFVKHILG